jgi:DNA polymerase-1
VAADAPLLVADVPWLLYRSFYALPESITGADGEPVNALLGCVNALLSVVVARAPRAVAACLGAEEATYRTELYPGYHAHREPMPATLGAQWRKAPALLERLGWYVDSSESLEADDVMFTHARLEAEAGGTALLVTGDRDLFAAVGDRVRILELGAGQIKSEIGPGEVRDRYGIGPELVADFIALRGDPSDGLPGAPGVGAKTAAALLNEFGSLESALAAAESSIGGAGQPEAQRPGSVMRPRTAAALCDNADLLRRFKEIATMREVAVTRPADRSTDFGGGAAFARQLGMTGLADRLALHGNRT